MYAYMHICSYQPYSVFLLAGTGKEPAIMEGAGLGSA